MKDFPQHYQELQQRMGELGKELPEAMKSFMGLHQCATREGDISCKFKELIALGIAVTVRCDGCIAFHVHDALEAGASRAEIAETLGVAVLMGGGPAVVYACEALEALEQFEKQR